MGMSASADIVFGVDLGERNPLVPWVQEDGYGYNDGEGVEEIIELLPEYRELEAEFSPYLDPRYKAIENSSYSEYEVWKAENLWFSIAQNKWWDKRKELEDKIPIEVKYYGYYDGEGSYALVIKDGPKIHAYDYGSKEFKLEDLVPPSIIKIQEALEFTKSVDLPLFENPTWLLLVSYG